MKAFSIQTGTRKPLMVTKGNTMPNIDKKVLAGLLLFLANENVSTVRFMYNR